ncbi:ankyrin repeat domain-containing protein 35 [Pelobates fuscus]|uniref:ankyrin repeat domain-containing protein 35 n=1 Tax=Pelobates fuscus TaxID=191477 RepID=UPI002FE48352
MKKIFSCSTSQVPVGIYNATSAAVDKWNRHDQKLFEAVEKGDAKRVSSVLAKKPIRPTKASPKGQSAFHLAASKGHTDCLNAIVSHKVEINAKTDDGYTALHLAASNCHPDCVKLLLQRGAHEDSIDFHSQTPLHCAAASGCVSSVVLLCDSEDTVLDAADDDGRTPLMVAAERNHPTVCSLLLDRGAQANLTDRENKTALILACEKSNIQAAEALTAKGADPRPKDNRGCDALAYATQSRDESLRKRVQTALDRRKSERASGECNTNHLVRIHIHSQTIIREQELTNMWKKRFEEEQKRGLWLQGDLMVKTQELESASEESGQEKIKMRKMVEELNGLLDGQTERQGATGQEFYTSDLCGLLNRVVEQAKKNNEHQQTERKLQEEKIKMLTQQTADIKELQVKHQEEVKQLQEAATAARENEDGARQRVVELEGHLENMREVLSQFEKRKRIQSTVVEDLQEHISEVIKEKEELEMLLKNLQEQEDTMNDHKKERPHNDHILEKTNITVLKEFLQKLRTDYSNLQNKTSSLQVGSENLKSCSGFVPGDVLEKNAGNFNKTITDMEKYLTSIDKSQVNMAVSLSERPDSGLGLPETVGEHKERHKNINGGLYHQLIQKVDLNLPYSQSGFTHSSGGQANKTECKALGTSHTLNIAATPEIKHPSTDYKDNIDSLKNNIQELQVELSGLKVSHDQVITQMNLNSQEKQNLEEGILALQERLQGEYASRQEMDAQCNDYKQQILLLTDELVAERRKLHQLNLRLAAQENEMLTLRDSFPPEILKEEHMNRGEMFKSDILEELYWNVGTLVMKYSEVLKQKEALQKDNQQLIESQTQIIPITEHNNILNEVTNKLDTQVKETEMLKQKLFQAMGNIVELRDQLENQAANSITIEEHGKEVASMEKIVASIREENQACKLELEKKNEEKLLLKEQLEQKVEELQTIKSREAESLKDYEQLKSRLEVQLQSSREEIQILKDKITEASREALSSKGLLSSERDRSMKLEESTKDLEREAAELKIKTHNCEEENRCLERTCDDLNRELQEKNKKMEESLKELDSLAKEVSELHGKYDNLNAELEETNKRHQEIVSIYRTHLLNAAQGLMDEDVHLTLHWILKMQSDVVY